ncbi:hypothetical protein ABZ128_03505 [Streptomyces sp. NPDC006326]|uniref:hypothetical protein n=1 Tax=Streptomyces sp. NPDC006326 TaxID=3156752 RepID=UPI0033B10574
MTRTPRPSTDFPRNRRRVPPLDAASRPRLARFLLRRYLRSAVVKAAGPDRPRPERLPRADAPAALNPRRTR